MLETVTYSMGARIASLAGGISNYNAFVTSGLIGETMSTAAASTVDIAAHQIAMQTWWLLSYFSFPLAMVGQALLPRDIAAGRSKRAKEVIILLMKMSAVVGALSTCVSLFQPTCMPGAFTDNVVVQRAVRFVLPQVALSQFLICIATVLDGIFIGSGRLGDYVNAGVVSTASAWLYFLFSMRFKYGLVGAWNGLLLFSSVRLAYWLSRLPLLFAGVNISKKGDLSSSKDEFQ
jgi:Na+-driven multidrug efflux pump